MLNRRRFLTAAAAGVGGVSTLAAIAGIAGGLSSVAAVAGFVVPDHAAHCNPEQAVAMADAAGARLFVPVHHQTFRLSREPFDEPIGRVEAALADERDRLAVREIGQTVRVA